MHQYVAGDPRAFQLLVNRMEPKIRRFLRSRTNDADLVDDLLQQTLMRVHASRGRYTEARAKRPTSVDQWFMTTAYRTTLDYYRGEYRRRARLEALTRFQDTVGFGSYPAPVTPEQFLSDDEQLQALRRHVRDVVDALPRHSAEVVRRHKLEGQAMNAIAQDLGVAAGTLRVRVHRAYRKLAVMLSTPGEPADTGSGLPAKGFAASPLPPRQTSA
ncbi:MAG: RNA polymerase sigma factor [Bacteroidota bacterium]